MTRRKLLAAITVGSTMKKATPVLIFIVACAGCRKEAQDAPQIASQRPHPTLALKNQKQMTLGDSVNFQNAFTAEKQCNGITLLTDGEQRADFVVLFAQIPDAKGVQQWPWVLSYPHDPKLKDKKNNPNAGIGGLGSRPSPEQTVQDVCLTIWDDVHAPYPVNPGGDIK